MRIVSTGLAAIVLALGFSTPSAAQEPMAPSTCRAIAQTMPGATYAAFDARTVEHVKPASAHANRRVAQAGDRETVTITYVRHATYRIETPAGVVVATDYAGPSGQPAPDVATMNKAHSSHNTPYPDPAIEHVLRGWNPDGGAARHAVTIGDLYVRNVPTDIRSFRGMEPDGNSIFIFETAGLCIGHVGHLHHELTDTDYADIGRLDILMVPVDGGYTMSQAGMGEIAERLRSSIVLPMHRFRGPIERFLDRMPSFAVERRTTRSMTVSLRTLPDQPTVVILDGV